MLQNGCCGRINNNPAIPTDFFLSSLVYQIITYCHLTVSVSQGVDSQGNLVFLKYSQLSLRLDHPALLSNGRYTAEVRLEDGRPKRRGTFWPTDSLFYMAPITCSGACVYVHMCVHMCVETPQVSYHLILYCRGNSCWQVHASPPTSRLHFLPPAPLNPLSLRPAFYWLYLFPHFKGRCRVTKQIVICVVGPHATECTRRVVLSYIFSEKRDGRVSSYQLVMRSLFVGPGDVDHIEARVA